MLKRCNGSNYLFRSGLYNDFEVSIEDIIMKKVKHIAVTMVIIMLITMFSSCSSVRKNTNVVKEDDPWYETTGIKLEKNLKPTDEVADTVVCTCEDRFFYAYCYSGSNWATSTTKLDSYDYEGNLLSSLTITCPSVDGFRIGRIYSLSASPDGKTIDAIIYFGSANLRANAFATIDTNTGIVSDIKDIYQGEAGRLKDPDAVTSTVTGIGEYAVAVTCSNLDGQYGYQMFLYKDTEFVAELDLSAISLRRMEDGFSIDPSTGSLYAVGYEDADLITMEFDIGNGQLKNKTSFQQTDGNKINFGEYMATDKGDMCKIDSFGNIMKIDVNTMTEQIVIETNWYTPVFCPVDTYVHSSGSQIISCTEERTVIMDSEETVYTYLDRQTEDSVRILTKTDKNPHAGKKIIELALPIDSGLTDYLARSINEFNKTDDEYMIRLWDKYKTGFAQGRGLANVDVQDEKMYQMIQDLKGKDAPDLVVGIQNNYAMHDEYFMDLSDFLKPEVMEKQYGNIIEAGRTNGKLYFLPVSIVIECLVTNADLVKDGAVGITFDDYDNLIEEGMHGFSPYDYPYSEYYNKLSFFLSCIDTKGAIDGESVDFDTPQFRAAAEYASKNFVYDDDAGMPEMDWRKQYSRNRGECYYTNITDFLDYVHACYRQNGHYAIIGTPSVDASGPRFKARETISVSATTDIEDGCRKFINYLFSGAAYESDDCEFWQIVTNKEIMSKNVEAVMTRNNYGEDILIAAKNSGAIMMSGGIEKSDGLKYASEDMCKSFLDSLGAISIYYYEDKEIVKFVIEELAPYYAGDRSLDEAIEVLNSRVTKYVKEM